MSPGADFAGKLAGGIPGALLYGITPPKASTGGDKLREIAEKRNRRIGRLGCDALVVYDIQDERERAKAERPFEFLPTLDPLAYAADHHHSLECGKVIYHAVGKYTEAGLRERVLACRERGFLSVFVGAATKGQATRLRLEEACRIHGEVGGGGWLGGVVIPERHRSKTDEHLRILDKQARGCGFFISQCICNVELVKNFISDYCRAAEERGVPKGYFVFTLTVCGNAETLALMEWLGVDVPRWMRNDLVGSGDFLRESIAQNLRIAEELGAYCAGKGLGYGFNVESVSPRKDEIEATVVLFEELRRRLPPA